MNSDAKTFSHVAYIRLKEFALLPHLVKKNSRGKIAVAQPPPPLSTLLIPQNRLILANDVKMSDRRYFFCFVLQSLHKDNIGYRQNSSNL